MFWRVPRLQFSEKVIGKQTRVGIVGVIRAAVGFDFLRLLRNGIRRHIIGLLNLLSFGIGRDNLDSFLLGCLCQLRVFELLTYCHTLSGSYELGQVGVERMMRKSGKLNIFVTAVGSASQCNT